MHEHSSHVCGEYTMEEDNSRENLNEITYYFQIYVHAIKRLDTLAEFVFKSDLFGYFFQL